MNILNNKDLLIEQVIKEICEYELLLEMAYNIKDIYRKIDDKIEEVIQHLVLCIVFTQVSTDTSSHWKTGVYNNIHQLYDCIIMYFTWLFKKLSESESVSLQDVSNYIDYLIDQYNK